jgi:hypothetical protein
MKETMRVPTIIELMRLSKIELCNLAAHMTNVLPDLPEGSAERESAVINLQHSGRLCPTGLLALTRENPPAGLHRQGRSRIRTAEAVIVQRQLTWPVDDAEESEDVGVLQGDMVGRSARNREALPRG